VVGGGGWGGVGWRWGEGGGCWGGGGGGGEVGGGKSQGTLPLYETLVVNLFVLDHWLFTRHLDPISEIEYFEEVTVQFQDKGNTEGFVIESVDSIRRDGADTQYMIVQKYISKSQKR